MTEPYGTDIAWVDADLPVGTGGDYLTMTGEENLRQAIFRRLLTKPGAFRARPGYGAGVGTWVKKPRNRSTINELEQRIREQLALEPRIAEVVELAVDWDANTPTVVHLRLAVLALGRTVRFAPLTFSEAA